MAAKGEAERSQASGDLRHAQEVTGSTTPGFLAHRIVGEEHASLWQKAGEMPDLRAVDNGPSETTLVPRPSPQGTEVGS
jgi:hypothetical protein